MNRSPIDSTHIDLPCHECSSKTKKSIAWVKAHKQFVCACGATVRFDASQLIRELGKVEAALAAFKKSFK